MAKILGKKVVVAAIGSAEGTTKGVYSNRLFGVGGLISRIAKILERTCFFLSGQVAVESPSAVHFLKLSRYRKKIAINGAMYVDTNLFSIKNRINERQNLVGFIGRLSEEKGVMNFVKAIPLILKCQNDVEFLIGGDGQLLNNLMEELKRSGCSEKTTFTGWIPHDKLPDYLNELKLLVLPSYTEGLPNIMLEAMACGTPVLATPVGAIPDVITDGETGFIMENNSPECIARNVIRALNHPNLERIAENARALVEREFTFEKAVERYKEILSKL